MWLLYVIALIVGGGLLLVQVLAGGDHHVGGLQVSLDDSHPAAGPGVVSTRSITFGVAAFGMVGAPLQILGMLSPRAALAVASLAALATTAIAGFAFRTLGHASASGAASFEELVGREGRVLLECGPDRRGKIRVALGGQIVDLAATTDEARIEAGTTVKIVAVRDDVAHVATLKGG
jgi:membrane protein implicated in regulation of membrane protease activity